jgi:phosphonate transport system substrate-binding protein
MWASFTVQRLYAVWAVVDELVFVSLMAPSADELWRGVAARLGLPTRVVDDVSWQERERMLYRGQAHVGVVCGLQYIHAQGVELLAAPVMRGARYRNQPVYFSDVVVRPGSQAESLADLRGRTWAVNEPTSHSGFNVTRYALAARGETSAFFGRVVESGSHENSIGLLLDGVVDATAVDSTVLETVRPDLKVIETLGPSPIPPVVVSRSVPRPIRERLRRALLDTVLGPVERFVAVSDADYDPIRDMQQVAQRLAPWMLSPPASLQGMHA